ncbi:MAG: DinB family protein [Acidobacteriota bacterium]
MLLEMALKFHTRAIERFSGTASAIAPERWTSPREPGKWSAAEVIEHVTSVYDVLDDELTSGRSMAVVTTPRQRILLRSLVMPLILVSGRFPKGARSPKELRPTKVESDPERAVARLRAAARRFETSVSEARRRRPPATVTHPYFGKASLLQAVLFCARHAEHHRLQVSPVVSRRSGSGA